MREAAKLIDSAGRRLSGPKRDFHRGPRPGPQSGAQRRHWRGLSADCRSIRSPPRGKHKSGERADADERGSLSLHVRIDEAGRVVPARRPANDVDFALEVPFSYPVQATAHGPVAAVIHAFYLDERQQLACPATKYSDPRRSLYFNGLRRKKAAAGNSDVGLGQGERRDLGRTKSRTRHCGEIRRVSRHLRSLRSVSAFAYQKVAARGTPLERWRDYLIDNLLGSPETVVSILSLFDDPKLGIVFPQHLFEIRGIIDWGYDYDMARTLMRRIGAEIHKNSSFWNFHLADVSGRSAAIRPLLDAGLTYADFPDENGQVDGTIAHAIERIVLMAAETRGFEWLKVVRRDLGIHCPRQCSQLTRGLISRPTGSRCFSLA